MAFKSGTSFAGDERAKELQFTFKHSFENRSKEQEMNVNDRSSFDFRRIANFSPTFNVMKMPSLSNNYLNSRF